MKQCRMCGRKNTKFSDKGLRHSSTPGDGFYEEEWICDECLEHYYDDEWLKKRRLPIDASEHDKEIEEYAQSFSDFIG